MKFRFFLPLKVIFDVCTTFSKNVASVRLLVEDFFTLFLPVPKDNII